MTSRYSGVIRCATCGDVLQKTTQPVAREECATMAEAAETFAFCPKPGHTRNVGIRVEWTPVRDAAEGWAPAAAAAAPPPPNGATAPSTETGALACTGAAPGAPACPEPVAVNGLCQRHYTEKWAASAAQTAAPVAAPPPPPTPTANGVAPDAVESQVQP